MRATLKNKITMPLAIPGLYKNGVFQPRFAVPKVSQPRKVVLVFLEETTDSGDDMLTQTPPPTKDRKNIVAAFRETGKYTEQFLKSFEKGLKRSTYFQ